MPPLPSTSIPSFLSSLSHSLPSSLPSPTPYLLPLLTSTTLGHSSLFLRPCLSLALASLPPRPSPVPKEPQDPRKDWSLHPRRATVGLIKESLVKSAVLIGVPRAIEALLELGEEVDEGDWSGRFVRRELNSPGQTVEERKRAGEVGLGRVYQRDLDGIFDRMQQSGLEDLRFLSQSTTYGTFLTPFPPSPSSSSTSSSPPSSNPDPFLSHPDAQRLFSLLTLSCLLPQRTPREIHWHLRGALRLGWTRGELEALQNAVERVSEACGVEGVGEGMPRVADVSRQKEEGQE